MPRSDPRASPSGWTWQANATLAARSIRTAARSRSSSIVVEVAHALLDASRGALGLVGSEGKLGRALEAGLASDLGLQAASMLTQRVEHDVVAVGAARGVDVD